MAASVNENGDVLKFAFMAAKKRCANANVRLNGGVLHFLHIIAVDFYGIGKPRLALLFKIGVERFVKRFRKGWGIAV